VRIVRMARDNNINKTAEQYGWLAAKCRETARTASDGKDRADLLATAQRWDLLADRVGRDPRYRQRDRRSATTRES
jgi:hypothetical protein